MYGPESLDDREPPVLVMLVVAESNRLPRIVLMAPTLGGARSAAKHFLEEHPSLKDNRMFYELQRWRGYRDVQLRPHLTSRPDLLADLDANGVVVIPDFVSRGEAADMLEAAEDVIERARRGELGPDDAYSAEREFLWRVSNADKLVPRTAPFFSDELIDGLARAYISPSVVSFRHEIDYRFGVGEVAQADLFHFDNWRPIFKAFLYLLDVGESNAPFAYLTGSHKGRSWRRPHEQAFDAYGTDGRFGHMFPQEIRRLRAENPEWEEIVCTGTAGTLILADLRGLHHGTPLLEGRRVLLNRTFDLMNAD